MIRTPSIVVATFFRTLQAAKLAAADHIHRFGNKYEIKESRLDRRNGFVVHYIDDDVFLCRQISNYIPKNGIEVRLGRIGSGKPKPKYQDDPLHPLYMRRRQPLKPYDIESNIPIPTNIINKKSKGISHIGERKSMPFALMEVGNSFFAPDTSVNALMRSVCNWRYKLRNNPFFEEDTDGEYKMVRKEFIVSEEYDQYGKFKGSRIWCIKKLLLTE